MVCNSCKNEFTNINGLKFCPYCGAKIEENIEEKTVEEAQGKKDFEVVHTPSEIKEEQVESIVEGDTIKKKHQDTLDMPVITDKDIKKYKRDKFFAIFKERFVHLKIMIPIIVLLVVIAGGAFAFPYFFVKPVDEARIKEDILAKVVTLPKGTSIEINKDSIKSFIINSRNTDKKNDEIKIALTLNNGVVEANTILSVAYIYEGNNQWKVKGEPVLEGVTSLKPVVGMDEKKFLSELKKLSIPIADAPRILGGEEVKKLDLSLRTPDLKENKEKIMVDASIDGGLLAATGKIKCNLVFENEAWKIATIVQNSTEDFKLVLSPTFSDEVLIQSIKKKGLDETVTYPNFFGGKGFAVKDSFTKSIKIAGKKLDMQNGALYVTAKRENVAGQINSILSTAYTFSISFSEISFSKGAKTTVDSGTVNNVSSEVIKSTITDAEIEGSNLFFWFSNNHKITTEEANTFKIGETLFRKGFENIKYVYGSINYKEGEKNNKVSFVAPYFLVYDGTTGYNWKLDKLVGEESPNYNSYSKAAKGQ